MTEASASATRRRAMADRDEVLQRGLDTVRNGSARAVRRLPNALFERLLPDEVKQALAASREPPRVEPPLLRSHRRRVFSWRFFRMTPLPLRGVLAAATIGAAAAWLAVAVEPLVVSSPHAAVGLADRNAWPRCRRLAPEADRCLYVVRSGRLTWSAAAVDLALPEPTLRAANSRLPPTDRLPPRAVLVIARDPSIRN